MNKVCFLFLLLFLTLSRTTFAQQPGYVITQKNDTIRCEVWKTAFGDGAKYKPDEKGKSIRIKVDDIKEYEIRDDTTRYRAVALKPGKDPAFLKMLEEGRICLYMQVVSTYNPNGMSNSTTNWYISKDMGDLLMLKISGLNLFGASHDERKNELAGIFSDNPKVAAEYKAEDSFSFKKIQKYVHEYNLAATVGQQLNQSSGSN